MISAIYPYYENPIMLLEHLKMWRSYPRSVLNKFHFIIVDDGSPNNPAFNIIEEFVDDIRISLLRIHDNIPWNQHGARNLGAMFAKELKIKWMFLCDMDILMDAAVAQNMVDMIIFESEFYMFGRGGGKVHPNTLLVTVDAYWKAGGYDEDYCGSYGGDGSFIKALKEHVEYRYIDHSFVNLKQHTRAEIDDCDTREWDRIGPYRQKFKEINSEKEKTGRTKSINPIRFTWSRII